MWAKLKTIDLFAVAASVVVLAVAALVGVLFFIAARADETAKNQEQAVVANAVNVRVEEIAGAAVDFARGAPSVTPFSAAFIMNGDGQTSGPVTSTTDRPGLIALIANAAEPLIAPLRQIEASRSDLEAAPPLQSSAVAAIADHTYVLTATLAPAARGASAHAAHPIAVTAQEIDADFLAVLADRLLLDDLQLHAAGASLPGYARFDLTDAAGSPVASLAWQPHTPGAELLDSALPIVFILIGALALVGAIIYRRGRQAARNLKASEARATHLAYHDALTGLPNRLLLSDRLGRAVEELRRRNTPFAVHCIDLDRFKDVNDTFGHAAGDELIRLAAQLISSACRSSDTVARLGGDEFAIVQVGATLDGAAMVAERIVALLTAPLEISVGTVHIGASIGVSYLTEAGPDGAECLRQADLALYRVKENGRGAYCLFEPEMDATVRFRRALEADLHAALANNELALAYQPQVDGSGRTIGLEALVRWTHRERGQLSPSIFIPIAEECGLIDQIGFFTLQRAFEDSRRWPGMKIAINLSPTQLRMKDFARKLGELVAATGVDARCFELEITEGVLLGDDPQTHAALNQIRELGFGLALDDFGTGYSSFSYLKKYPVDKIKIDRSFIASLGVDREADAVVAAIVRLARALNLSVIAEGVETNEQRLRLSRAGCQEVQGFLFGKAMAAEMIDTLLSDERSSGQPAQEAV